MSYPVIMPAPNFDPTYAAKLYKLFAATVHRRLRSRFRAADSEVLADAVVDAVMALATTAEVSEAMVYVRACGKAYTRLRSEWRRKNWEKKAETTVTKSATAATTVLEEIADRELLRVYQDRIARTPEERELLAVWVGGCVHPAAAAVALGVPVAKVKTTYARLRKRLSRERTLAAAEAS